MTTLNSQMLQCHRCKKVSKFTRIGSTNSMGACDLDTRPPEMARSTMDYWVQECPHCGYVASRITDGTTAPDALFESEEYKTCSGIAFKTPRALKFYRLYLVKKEEKDARNAFWSAMQAAWASDDAGDAESALTCRELAIAQLELMIAEKPDEESFKLLKLDLLRRTRRFSEVAKFYKTLGEFSDPFLGKIAAFEARLAKKQDDARHDVGEI